MNSLSITSSSPGSASLAKLSPCLLCLALLAAATLPASPLLAEGLRISTMASAPAPADRPPGDSMLRLSDIVQAELRPGWREADGRQMAALHLRLAPEWKTYWRRPGDAGIPPEFDWSGSQNLGAVRIIWPRPEVFDFQGMQTIGYREDLILPVEITPADPSQPVLLKTSIDLGLCKEICVPASLMLAAPLAGPGAPDPLITQALRDQPLGPREAGLGALNCTIEPISDGLRVTARMELPPGTGDETVVMEPAEPAWVSDAVISRAGGMLTAVADIVPGRGRDYRLDPAGLRLTVLSAGRAVEVTGCPAG